MSDSKNNDNIMAKIPGMPVWGIVPGCPAHKAGVRVGDTVIEVDGKPTPDVKSYWAACKDRGAVTKITVFRPNVGILDLELHLKMEENPS